MATVEDADRLALSLPEVEPTTSYGAPAWAVRRRVFAWVRRFSAADLRRLEGQRVPPDPILALRVDGLDDKAALLQEAPAGLFTIEHLDGHPIVLVELAAVDAAGLAELIEDAWFARAPATLVRERRRA